MRNYMYKVKDILFNLADIEYICIAESLSSYSNTRYYVKLAYEGFFRKIHCTKEEGLHILKDIASMLDRGGYAELRYCMVYDTLINLDLVTNIEPCSQEVGINNSDGLKVTFKKGDFRRIDIKLKEDVKDVMTFFAYCFSQCNTESTKVVYTFCKSC